jgi:hypothetical protein
MIWEKAQELYQMEQAKTMGEDFKGITAERKGASRRRILLHSQAYCSAEPLARKERFANHRRRGSRTRIFPNLTRAFKIPQKPKSELQTEKRGFSGDIATESWVQIPATPPKAYF